MLIRPSFTAAALAAMLALPVLAGAQPANAPPSASDAGVAAGTITVQTDFLRQQTPSQWRASKLVGASVYGPDNTSIGTINDLVLDGEGQVAAAVVGVGGFLGIGEKNVAIPFRAMQIQRKPNTTSIERVMVGFTRQQLADAPAFGFLQANERTTTGSNRPRGANGNSGQ